MAEHVVIIGNGIAGVTTARHIRKLGDFDITIVSGESKHFFSRTALMYIYMGYMRFEDTKPYEDWFWEKNRIQLKQAWVRNVSFGEKKLELENGEDLYFDKLVLATGSSPNKFGWPGQELKGVQGFYSLQDLANLEKYTSGIERAVIVGGGLIGIEVAEMLHSRGIHVTFLVREQRFWSIVLPKEESEMINRHILKHGIDLRLNTELAEIKGDENGRVRSVMSNDGKEIDCQFVALTAGVHPNIDFLKNSELECDKGIVVDEFLQTNIPNVYAAGDCAQLRNPPTARMPIEAVWYVGRMQGEILAQTICGNPTPYNPGVWFNSAKFFDIEYQVYGQVPPVPDPKFDSVYWEHSEGKKSIRIVFNEHDEVVGFNLMGIRYRHSICNYWIESETKLRSVLENLGAANFDPEFFEEYEYELVGQFNHKYPDSNIALKQKRGLSNISQLFS